MFRTVDQRKKIKKNNLFHWWHHNTLNKSSRGHLSKRIRLTFQPGFIGRIGYVYGILLPLKLIISKCSYREREIYWPSCSGGTSRGSTFLGADDDEVAIRLRPTWTMGIKLMEFQTLDELNEINSSGTCWDHLVPAVCALRSSSAFAMVSTALGGVLWFGRFKRI